MASGLIAGEEPNVQARASRTNGSTNMEIECFSWITRSGGKLQVSTPKPLQHSPHASSKFLNFATVLGPARQGKSFLMNCLLGNSVFRTSDDIDVCTKGVQVTSAVHGVGNGGVAFFVDTEGKGDEDVDSDTTLLTPILLLSKVILFNWKGGLQKDDILHELAILVEVGNCVSSKSFGKSKKFGHLHIVLRDFPFEGTVEEAYKEVFDEENRRNEKVKERNRIREKLFSLFESIDVCIIPVPCEDVQDLNFSATSEKFQKKVKKLKDAILRQMSQPRRFGSVVVSFQNVDVLVRKFVGKLEDGDIVHVESAIVQLQREVVDEAKRKFEESLIEAYKEIHVPVRDGLEELLIQKRDEHLDMFRKSTAEVDLEAAYRDDVLKNLDRFADRKLDAKRKENLLAIQSRIAEQDKNQEGSGPVQHPLYDLASTVAVDVLKTAAGGLLNWALETYLPSKEPEKCASAREEEKVAAKYEEEKCLERSDQQVRLSKADKKEIPVSSEWQERSSIHREKFMKLHEKSKKHPEEIQEVNGVRVCFSKDFLIGKGSDGTRVYVGLGKDGVGKALKRLPRDACSILAEQEKKVLNELNTKTSQHVVNYWFLEEQSDKNYLFLIMDLCEETLENFVKRSSNTDLATYAPDIIQQVLKGIVDLHRDPNPILHRDLKPSNILRNSQNQWLLADFGISRILAADVRTHVTKPSGTEDWKAVETCSDDGKSSSVCYKKESDIQVAGMVAFYIQTKGEHPFGPKADRLRNLLDGKPVGLDKLKEAAAKDLIAWMLSHDPKDRPSAEEALKHPYLQPAKQQFQMLCEVGNQREIKMGDVKSDVVRKLNNNPKDWRNEIAPDILTYLSTDCLKGRRFPYKSSWTDCLRLIRNVKEHWEDRPRPRREEFYIVEDPQKFFLHVFPNLCVELHKIIRSSEWKERDDLKEYFI